MAIDASMEPMLEVFIFETTTLLEQLDEILLSSEKTKSFSSDNINEIFRVMHTIKGSAAMMDLASISTLAHAVEDVFYIIREQPEKMFSVNEAIFDLVFQASDFLKEEIGSVQSSGEADQDPAPLIDRLREQASILKGETLPAPHPAASDPAPAPDPAAPTPTPADPPRADVQRLRIYFEEGCQMENIRAFMLLSQLREYCDRLGSIPANPESDSNLANEIIKNGLTVIFTPAAGVSMDEIYSTIENAVNIKAYGPVDDDEEIPEEIFAAPPASETPAEAPVTPMAPTASETPMTSESAATVWDTAPPDIVPSDTILSDDVEAVYPEQVVQAPASLTIDTLPTDTLSAEELTAVLPTEPLPVADGPVIQAAPPIAPPISEPVPVKAAPPAAAGAQQPQARAVAGKQQSLISVNQTKLDQLMDLVGELVTTESMVVSNNDLKGLHLDSFTKSARELRKLTDELQDVVMSIRMVPLSGVFQKMNRIVRDMCKKLDKEAELITIGGETEVDKTINEAIGDPFMHMVRNAVDHAIEEPAERIRLGKPQVGTVTMEAKNIGGEIVITIADDGKGLDASKLLAKAKANGLLQKPEADYTDKEIFGLIMLPGFSTNAAVTEFSGRGVGMDVVRKNIEKVGGSISIDSKLGVGTTFTIKIPLTLAIVDGMEIAVGHTIFTLPITSIQQSFKISEEFKVIYNTDGTEMILLRGECFPLLRLHRIFDIQTEITDLSDGIVLLIEGGTSIACIFADELLGEQQVVVKPFPAYLNKYSVKQSGLSGCTILGDGNISLILDANNLLAAN